MNIIPFQSQKPETPFAPYWGFGVGEHQTDIDCDLLKEFLLSKEEEVLSIPESNPTAYGTYLGEDSTTARSQSYNVLTWDNPQIEQLKKEIVDAHNYYYQTVIGNPPKHGIRVSGWMNIMRKGDRIRKHVHGYGARSYLSGHFTVCCEDTRTVYVNPYEHWSEEFIMRDMEKYSYHHSEKVYAPENVSGKLTLFPNYIPHFTTEHQGDDLRITIAFDISPIPDPNPA